MNNLQLLDPADGIRKPLRLWPKQREALDFIHTYLNILLLKSRQSGFSTIITGLDSMIHCMLIECFHVLVLSKTGPDADSYLEKQKKLYMSFDNDMYDKNIITPVKLQNGKYSCRPDSYDKIGTVDQITFKNGSTMTSTSACGGRSGTFDRVIIDEAAHITKSIAKIDLSTVYDAISPTLDVAKGQLILVTTALGMNTFHDMYQASKKPGSKFKSMFFSCWDDPKMTPDKRIEKASVFLKQGNGEDHVNQEYPRDDMEAFLSSGRPRFNKKSLAEYRKKELPELHRGFLNDDGTLEKNELGDFVIIKKREQRAQYLIVSDVAEGLEHGDNSTAKIFDRETLDQVAEWCGKCEPSDLGDIDCRLGKIYNHAIIAVERNKDGRSTIDTIVKHNQYPPELVFEHNSIMKEHLDDDFKDPSKRFGWVTSPITRPIIVNNLGVLIADMLITGFLKADLDELIRFVIINGKAQAEHGYWDDRVMTLAIAYFLLTNEAFNMAYPYINYQPYMTCFTCKLSSYRYGDEKAVCELTDRVCYKDDVCRLYDSRIERD